MEARQEWKLELNNYKNGQMSLIDRKNVVLLGLGRAGKFHIQSIQAIPGLRLKCVVDVDEARAKRLALASSCLLYTSPSPRDRG